MADYPSYEGVENMKRSGNTNDEARLVVRLGFANVPHQTDMILNGAAADALRLFVRRNREYGDTANNLGVKGQFSDIHRKVMKLKNILWDESVAPEDVTEGPEEIMMDLIGHCLLGIQMLREDPRNYGPTEKRGHIYTEAEMNQLKANGPDPLRTVDPAPWSRPVNPA